MSKKVLLFGATGMAGHILYKSLFCEKGFELVATSRIPEEDQVVRFKHLPYIFVRPFVYFDVLDTGSWSEFLDTWAKDADFVINCVGVLVKDSIERPDIAVTVNSLFPRYLENYFKDSKTRIIHISTDCVFDGSKGNYLVTDLPTETNMYGKSKSLGEIWNKKDLTIRTSIIGLEKWEKKNKGLLEWFLSQEKGSTLSGYSQCFWSGISTLELKDVIIDYLHYFVKNPNAETLGLEHVSRPTKISKYELLKHFNEVFERGCIIEPSSTKSIDKSLVPHVLYKHPFMERDYLEMVHDIASIGRQ
jgi:dTDP-4-dehydrorhamnose reductase